MISTPNSRGDAPGRPVRRPARWAAASALLLVPVALVLLQPDVAPPSAPPAPTAHSTAPAPADPEPALPEVQPAVTAPPETELAPVAALPGTLDPGEEQTLYLTIAGDQVYRVMGPVSGRPPRIDQLPGLVIGTERAAAEPGGAVPGLPGAGFVIADQEPATRPLGPDERPLGPAPQECPRTLPPGSDQATADGLRRQSGCRYLSSCAADTKECTFFYQGRG